MIRAVLKDGVLHPVDPIPADWMPGQQALVEEGDRAIAISDDIDQWLRDLNSQTAALFTAEEWSLIEQNLNSADQQAKEYVRREMGLH